MFRTLYTLFIFRNGYSLEVTLLLSVFLGMFGLDRFYLGYPGIGLAKLCTLGFMFLGQLLDIILIAAQVRDLICNNLLIFAFFKGIDNCCCDIVSYSKYINYKTHNGCNS